MVFAVRAAKSNTAGAQFDLVLKVRQAPANIHTLVLLLGRAGPPIATHGRSGNALNAIRARFRGTDPRAVKPDVRRSGLRV